MAVSGKVRVKKCEISEKVRAEKWKFWYGLFVNHKAALPLKFYEGMESFKLYYLDCGLMGALTEAPADQILIGDNVFVEYNGAFTEQFVMQQLAFGYKLSRGKPKYPEKGKILYPLSIIQKSRIILNNCSPTNPKRRRQTQRDLTRNSH